MKSYATLEPMSDMVLRPSDIGIILTYRCTSSCRHCLYNCGPGWKDWMHPSAVTEALEATTQWDHPYKVHLTGGEPFLNLSLLKHAIREATRLGIMSYAETSAAWCTNRERGERVFSDLKESGLEEVLVSCSPFHAETIPPKRTFAAIEAALDVFGPRKVTIYLPHCAGQLQLFDTSRTTGVAEYVQRFGVSKACSMLWDGYSIISGGRSGYRLGFLAAMHPAEEFRGENCLREILFAHHSHFDLYGNYIQWFCGGLSVGPWRRLPELSEEFRAGIYPPLIDRLIRFGPFGLYELATASGYRERQEGYAGKCHLCVDIRRHLSSVRDWSELVPKAFYSNI